MDTDVSVGLHSDLALGSDNRIHIVCRYSDQATEHAMKYIYRNGSDWVVETVETDEGQNVGMYPSITLDIENRPHLTYRLDHWWPPVERGYRYAVREDGEWILFTIDECEWGQFSSIALDDEDNPCIVYQDGENGRLMQAWLEPAGVTIELEYFMATAVGDRVRLAWQLAPQKFPPIDHYSLHCRPIAYRRFFWNHLADIEFLIDLSGSYLDVSPPLGVGITYRLDAHLTTGEVVTLGYTETIVGRGR